MNYLLLLDKLVSAVSMVVNLLGSSTIVSTIIARRIEENREWTDAERETIKNEIAANKAYAKAEIDKGD